MKYKGWRFATAMLLEDDSLVLNWKITQNLIIPHPYNNTFWVFQRSISLSWINIHCPRAKAPISYID